MKEILLLIPACFVYIAYRNKTNVLLCAVLLFYAIGATVGFVQTIHSEFIYSQNYGHQNIALMPTVYLIIACLLSFAPLFKAEEIRLNSLIVPIKPFRYMVLFVFVLAVAYSIALIPQISVSLNAVDFSEYKAEVMEKGGVDVTGGSVILKRFFYLYNVLKPFLSFLFCYSLAKFAKEKKYNILLGFATLVPPFLNSLAAGHRNVVVYLMFEIAIAYLFFKDEYDNKTIKVFKILAIISGTVMAIIVVGFAILRFSDDGSAFFEYNMLRYLGEPFVNFNTMLWGTDYFMDGNKCFPWIRDFLGYSIVDDADIHAHFSGANYVTYYFYGFVGNVYMDFGPYLSMLIIAFISLIFYYLIYRSSLKKFEKVLLLYLFAETAIKNYFYFDFMSGSNIRFIWSVWVFIILCLVFRFYGYSVRYKRQ